MTVDEKKNAIDNERAKLTANFLNGIAIAIIVVAGLAPMVNKAFAGHPPLIVAAQVGGCILSSGGLHLLARNFLRGALK